jgi:tRNA threonylcarbamoyladenosine modification (KEOPS) complex  Pcc1 subunit
LRGAGAEAEIWLPFSKKPDAEALRRALAPEAVARRTRRASVRVVRRDRVVKMRFSARDLIALRAMVNSYLRLAATWRRVSEALEREYDDLTP